ncbi:MFS general substrate transporter [Sarocladium strictum]
MMEKQMPTPAPSSLEQGSENTDKHDDGHDHHPWPIESVSFVRETLLVFVVCMAQFCTQAAFMGTLVLLRDIGSSFGVNDPPRLAWLVAGYSLTVGTFILLSGRLGDIFGYKRLFVIGLAWFAVWSMVAGVSVYSNFTLAVFSRVLQGIGPALCLPNALAIFGVMYPPGHRKAMVFAIFGAVAPVGGVAGGAVAAALDILWWPWAQWAMAIWLIILGTMAFFVIPDLPQETDRRPKDWKAWALILDLPGSVIGVAALVLFNFAFTQSPIDGWDKPVTLVPLILGVIMFVVFLYIEFKVSEMPLLPYDAVNTDVAFILAAVCFGWASFGIWTLYLTRVLQDIRGMSPLLTIAWFAPAPVSGALASVVTGKLLGPWNVRPAMVMVGALTCFLVGITLTATAPVNQIYWAQFFMAAVIMPWGMDSSFPAGTLIVSNAAAKEHQGVAASLINTVVNYGIALGVGFAEIVVTNLHSDTGDSLDNQLKSYRGGLYMGVGLAGAGLVVALVFLTKDTFWRKSSKV